MFPVNEPKLLDYYKPYPTLKNSPEFDMGSIFEEKVFSTSSCHSLSSTSSSSYDLLSSGVTIDDFPNSDVDVEELTTIMFEHGKLPQKAFEIAKAKIQNLFDEGKLFGCILKKMMTITDHLQHDRYPEFKDLGLSAFKQKIDESNVYFCLNDAYKMNSKDQIKICLNYIENFSSLKLNLFENNLSVVINSLKLTFSQISTIITLLSKIFDSNVFVSLEPTYLDSSLIEGFIKNQGTHLHSLSINPNVMEVSDLFLEKIIKYCPNLYHLSIKSKILTGTSLNKLHQLNNLVSLNLSWCLCLTHVPKKMPKSLLKVDISNCNSLQQIESEFSNLQELDVSFCIKLKKLPTTLPKTALVTSNHCWNLADSSIS